MIRRRILPFECEGQVKIGADILDEKKNKVGKVTSLFKDLKILLGTSGNLV